MLIKKLIINLIGVAFLLGCTFDNSEYHRKPDADIEILKSYELKTVNKVWKSNASSGYIINFSFSDGSILSIQSYKYPMALTKGHKSEVYE